MQEERRKHIRPNLMYYSRAFDRRTGRVVGYIMDITPEGAMIISRSPIEPEYHFRLRMDLPEELSDKPFIDFEARSVWCKRDMDPHFWATGFQLTQIQPSNVELIERMVAEYSFHNHQPDRTSSASFR
jgi:hypothetical protein